MSERVLRLGLVGSGRRGQAHASTIRGFPDLFSLVGVCDVSEPSARATAAQFGANAYSDLRDFFSREKLDAVVIATPPEVHHLAAEIAAEHGVHMLIETPLAITRAMMDAVEEAVDRHGVFVEVGENMWRRPTGRLAKRAVENGVIGKVLRLSNYYESAGHDSCYHTIGQLRCYAGSEIKEVQAFSQRFELDPSVTTTAPGQVVMTGPYGAVTPLSSETWFQAQLFFESGALGSVTYVTDWIGPLRRGHPRFLTVEGTEGFLVTGDAGIHFIQRVEQGVARTLQKEVQVERLGDRDVPVRFLYPATPPVEWANPFADRDLADVDPAGVCDGLARADQLLALYRGVAHGEPPQYSVANARRDQDFSIAIIEAARRGERLSLAGLGPETPWERTQHDAFRERFGVEPFGDARRLVGTSGTLPVS